MPIKNPIVKSQFIKFVESEDLDGYDEPTLFEMFSIFCTEQGHLNRNFDYSDIHFAGSEFGIDGVATVANDELVSEKSQLEDMLPLRSVEFHFYQSKSGEKLKSGDLGNFFSAIEDFFDEDFQSTSDDLNNHYSMKNYIYENSADLIDAPVLRAFFINTGKHGQSDAIEKRIRKTSKRLKSMGLFSEVFLEIVDADRLQSFYRAAIRSIVKTITFEDSVVLPSSTNTAASYLGFIEAGEIVKLVSSENGNQINKSVFVDNIRDFNPNSEINKEISKSLSIGEGDMFVFRNNGITAVAKSIRPIGKDFRISDFQIVNGCQTSHILFNNQAHLKSVYVPFRLIEARDDKTISSVIIGTNSQNPVGPEQLWALRPFMKNFEEYCSSLSKELRIFIERRDGQYRENSTVQKSRIITLRNLMQSVAAALLFFGGKANRSYAGIRKEHSEHLFLENHDLGIYHFAAFAFIRYDYFWRTNKIDKSFKIYKFFILSAIGMVLSGEDEKIPLYGKTVSAKAAAMSIFISDDDNFQSLLTSITKSISKVMKGKDMGESAPRDFIKKEPIHNELLLAFTKIPNPLL